MNLAQRLTAQKNARKNPTRTRAKTSGPVSPTSNLPTKIARDIPKISAAINSAEETHTMTTQENRLAEIRKAIDAENVSLGELSELQDLAATHPELFADDPVLAQCAGIPEEDWRGPWALGIETDDTSAQVINGSGQHVCTVAIDPLPDHARLIAAAPDLLEALRGLLDQLEAVGIYIPGEDSGQWHEAEGLSFRKASEAIARAEGRATQ